MNNATGTGYYYFETGSDGLCEYSTKTAAVNNAKTTCTTTGWIDVISPSGIVVATVQCDKVGDQL